MLLTWKKDALQHRGLCGGRGLLLFLFVSLSSSKTRSMASSLSTILTADTNGVGFCRARARALLTTAHISLPEITNSQQIAKLASLEARTTWHTVGIILTVYFSEYVINNYIEINFIFSKRLHRGF